MERWERYVKKNQRILFSPVLFHNLPSPLFFPSTSPAYVKPVFSPAKILSIREEEWRKDSRRGGGGWTWGDGIGWKSAMGTRGKTLQREQTEEERKKRGKRKKGGGGWRRERENSLRVEFPLLFDLPTHAFCFPTADVALEIKDLKHTPREGKVRGGGIVSSPVFPSRFFSPFYRPCLRRSQIVREKPRSYTFV